VLLQGLAPVAKPSSTSPLSTCPPWTISPLAPTVAAASACTCISLRLGMRMLLLGLATFTM
jgi:hypothetical protein